MASAVLKNRTRLLQFTWGLLTVLMVYLVSELLTNSPALSQSSRIAEIPLSCLPVDLGTLRTEFVTEVREDDTRYRLLDAYLPGDAKQTESNNAVLQHPNFSKPPASFLFVGRWFRFGIVLFLLLSVLLGTSGCSGKATNPWSAATSVVPLETVQAVVAENSGLNPQEAASNVLAWTVDGQAGRLVVFNFNNPSVCGSAGCLYAAYLVNKDTSPARVFSSYLNPSLPPDIPLFQVADESPSNFQCSASST